MGEMGGDQQQKMSTKSRVGPEGIAEYAKVFDYMLEGCQIISRDFRYLYVNDVVAKQGRSTKERLIGNTMMECYPGIEKTEVFEHIRNCIERKEVHRMENEFTFPDGTVGWFELRMEPLPEGAIILSVDITDFKKAAARVKQLEELKSTFVYIITRQLQMPFAAMQESLEKLRSIPSESLGLDERTHVLTAHNAAIDIFDNLQEILTAVHTGDTQPILNKKPVRFSDIWSPVYAECKQKSEVSRLRLVYTEPSMPLPTIECDPDRVRLAIIGLVDNAFRYTPDGKVVIVIDHINGRLRFQVSDTGVGLSEADHRYVFAGYFRGDNAKQLNPNGTGLSLAVIKYYIEQHGGAVGFTSTPEKGSTFWFDLPLG